MGGRRETPDDRRQTGQRKTIVRPSELHTYTYCPRLLFFELHLHRRRSLREYLRLALGKVFHLLFRVSDAAKGLRSEEPLLATIGSVELRGRADAIKVTEKAVHIIERKSSRPPSRGAWISDVVQAASYAIQYAYTSGSPRDIDITIEVRYPSARRLFRLTDDIKTMTLRSIDEVSLLKRAGVVPYAKRGRRCARCPYKGICEALDSGLESQYQDELGLWLRDLNIVT